MIAVPSASTMVVAVFAISGSAAVIPSTIPFMPSDICERPPSVLPLNISVKPDMTLVISGKNSVSIFLDKPLNAVCMS